MDPSRFPKLQSSYPERLLGAATRELFVMPDPEAIAREDIDRQLQAAGWIMQDRAKLNIHAGPGVAVREVSIPGFDTRASVTHGDADDCAALCRRR
jgi:hypothetical protein